VNITPQSLTAIITASTALIAAIAGLVTAIKAHSTALVAHAAANEAHNAAADAHSKAQTSSDRTDALHQLFQQVLPLLAASPPASPEALARVQAVTKTPVASDELKHWLAEQHRSTTGSYPGSPNTPTSPYSLTLDEIAKLGG
jgi:predicted metal-dependent hydrolase